MNNQFSQPTSLGPCYIIYQDRVTVHWTLKRMIPCVKQHAKRKYVSQQREDNFSDISERFEGGQLAMSVALLKLFGHCCTFRPWTVLLLWLHAATGFPYGILFFNSIQFSFFFIAPNHNIYYVKALYIVRLRQKFGKMLNLTCDPTEMTLFPLFTFFSRLPCPLPSSNFLYCSALSCYCL